MGVPGLFSHLRKYNKANDAQSTIKSTLPDESESVHLYLDFNGAIYQVIKPEIKTEDTFILHILEYLNNLINIFDIKPDIDITASLDTLNTNNIKEYGNSITKLFIAIDGVPPRAKMEQQRQRRFHSIIRKHKTSQIDTKYGNQYDKSDQNIHIDTNMITPGTAFMDKLRRAIRDHINTIPKFRKMEVLFSDWSCPGEGEHKIFEHLRINPPANDIKTVIYGLDGDLIMLSLASQINNLYLIREAYEYGQYAFQHEGYPYLFMDIDCLKTSLILETTNKRIGTTLHMSNHDVSRFIDDYVVLMMMLGNDFMPKIHWIGIKNNGHEILLSTYFQVQNSTDGGTGLDTAWLFNRNTSHINMMFLRDMLIILARREDKLASDFVTDRAKKHLPIPSDCSERKRQQLILDYLPMQYLDIEAQIRIGQHKWRGRYYKTCLDIPGTPENIAKICEAYVRTLIWNANYYIGNCLSWDWYFPYDYGPTLADLLFYVSNYQSHSHIKWTETTPIDCQTLLLMVLPLSSGNLMARNVECAVREKQGMLAIYFPDKYEINLPFHTRYYECTPKIPRIPIKYAEAVVKSAGLSTTEAERNKYSGIIHWNKS